MFQDELLASQHHDDNSVACIEEKCYILGTTQYCRYCIHDYFKWRAKPIYIVMRMETQ